MPRSEHRRIARAHVAGILRTFPHLNRLRGLFRGKLLLLPHLPVALVTVLARRNSRAITANHRLLL